MPRIKHPWLGIWFWLFPELPKLENPVGTGGICGKVTGLKVPDGTTGLRNENESGQSPLRAGLDSSSDSSPKMMEFFFLSVFREQFSLGKRLWPLVWSAGCAHSSLNSPQFSSLLLQPEEEKPTNGRVCDCRRVEWTCNHGKSKGNLHNGPF